MSCLTALLLGNRNGTHCIGGWVGPRADLDQCGKTRLHRDFFFIFSYTLHFIRTCVFVLIVLHFAFIYITQHKRDSNPQPQQANSRRPSP